MPHQPSSRSATAARCADRGRLALFVPDLRGGGAERVTVNLAARLVERGHPTDLVMLRNTGPYVKLVPPGVRVFELRRDRVSTAILPLALYLRRERPAALISALDHANVAAILASTTARVGTSVIVVNHALLSAGGATVRPWRERLQPAFVRFLYRRADAVVAVSEGAADQLARIAHVPRDRIHVIPNAVVSATMVRLARELPGHRWLADGGPPVILSAGRLEPEKDHALLLEAFALLRQRREVRLIVLGEGGERDALQRLAHRLGVSDAVDLPGFVANPFAFMARAALFVLSSRREAAPTVLVEALACGARIVSTDCDSGPREILDAGRLGRLVPVGDANALAEAMARALGDPRPSGVAELLERNDVDAAVDAYLRLVSNVTPGWRGTPSSISRQDTMSR